jgi:hypothetical protein
MQTGEGKALPTHRKRRTKLMPRNIKPKVVTARVIVDSRDASRDYLLLRSRAEELFQAHELEMINCYSGQWDYCDPRGRYRREQVRRA